MKRMKTFEALKEYVLVGGLGYVLLIFNLFISIQTMIMPDD
jgi:hypothetical protein